MDTPIDWMSDDSNVLLNPRTPAHDRERLFKILKYNQTYSSHIWLATSGTTGNFKWTALSKQAILFGAEAVNDHLQVTSKDTWLNCLPVFHIGGLAVLARCFLSGAKLMTYSGKWDARECVRMLTENAATLTSLVTTQVYDIVMLKLKPPSSLRAVVVGGGELSEHLYLKARKLGWRLLPSYGMTECASQIATASLDSLEKLQYPSFVPLKHIELKLDRKRRLKVKSPALLTTYALPVEGKYEFTDPKVEGWLLTDDKPKMHRGNILKISREETFIKINGESVDVSRLDKILEEERLALGIKEDTTIIPLPDPRRGHSIHLAVVYGGEGNMESLVNAFNRRVFPFERIQGVDFVPEIPRSPLNKVLRKSLAALIAKTKD